MLTKETVHKVLDAALSEGADFAEVFAEDSRTTNVVLQDRKIEEYQLGNHYGVGIRVLYGTQAYYGHSNDTGETVLVQLADDLARSSKSGGRTDPRDFQVLTVQDRHQVREAPDTVSQQERVDLLRSLDKTTRAQGAELTQVRAGVIEKHRQVLIANSEGLWAENKAQYARLVLRAIAEKGDGPQDASESPGVLGGYEFFRGLDVTKLSEEVAQSALRMAGAGYIEGGSMPVVLGNGFGGVIFHEACGHPLETEAIRKGASPFVGKVGERVGQPILTAVDDGTLDNYWGSINIDDEGTPAQRTVLIKDGILQSFLSDRIGAGQVGMPRTGSAR